MTRPHAGGDAQGPAHAGTQRRRWSIARTDFPGVAGDRRAARSARRRALCRAQARPFRRQAASLRRRRQKLGGTAGAGVPGRCARTRRRCFRSGRWRRAAPTSRGGSGPAHSRPACSAPTIAARRWQLVRALWDVPERAKWFGGGYDDAGIHSISPIRAIPTACSWRSPAAASGRRATTARAGRCRARACSRPTCRRSRPDGREIAGPAPRRALRRRAGHDVDAASQRHLPLDRRRAPTGRSSSRRATTSASRSRCIRAIRTPPGSCPRSRTSCACRATARSW